ncbi:hypothetical protein B10204_13940 [Campylobacter jejuni]|nr:hypothetical protein B10204_13940 [Campylobacter jejuni]
MGCGILKFKTIKIFQKKKYNGLLVSSRIDNFGMRMLDMVIGMYLAEKLNFKFFIFLAKWIF